MLWKRLYLNIFLGMRVLALLWVVLCGIRTTNAASHSMKLLYTGVTSGDDLQKYTAVGLVDDVQIMYYESNTRRMIPKTEWIKEIEGEDFWDRESWSALDTQESFREIFGNLHLNQNDDVHTLQLMVGCDWDDETRVTGRFNNMGYDGRDFVHMDMQKYRYTASVQEGHQTASSWNEYPVELEVCEQFMNQTCDERLKRYLGYRRSGLERTVVPGISLLQKNSSSPVTCHVTGFYPRGAMVTWQKDGVYQDVDVELGETLPNGDGTFQIRSHLWVKPEAWKKDRYTCTVQHKSLEQPIVLQVTESNIKSNRNLKRCVTDPEGCSPPVGIIIIGCVVGALLLILTVIGVFIWRKRSSDSDTASESSNSPEGEGPRKSEDSGCDSVSSGDSGPSNSLLSKA